MWIRIPHMTSLILALIELLNLINNPSYINTIVLSLLDSYRTLQKYAPHHKNSRHSALEQ